MNVFDGNFELQATPLQRESFHPKKELRIINYLVIPENHKFRAKLEMTRTLGKS